MRAGGKEIVLAVFFAGGIFSHQALAQAALTREIRPGEFIAAAGVERPPRLDGLLDDESWKSAQPLANFTQVLPMEGAPPTERTEVRFVYTRDVLFIAIRCFDRAPSRILAQTMQRDNAFDSDDYVKIAFDTFGRQRDGYVFMVNPAGARTDSIFGRFSSENRDFDALWDARARINSEGWTRRLHFLSRASRSIHGTIFGGSTSSA